MRLAQPRATEAANRIGPVCDQMIITVEQRKLKEAADTPQGATRGWGDTRRRPSSHVLAITN